MNIAQAHKGHTTHLGGDAGVDVMEKIAMETTLSAYPPRLIRRRLCRPTRRTILRFPTGPTEGTGLETDACLSSSRRRGSSRDHRTATTCGSPEAAGVTARDRPWKRPRLTTRLAEAARPTNQLPGHPLRHVYGSNPLDRGATGTMGIGAGITQRSSTNEPQSTTRVTRQCPGYSGVS